MNAVLALTCAAFLTGCVVVSPVQQGAPSTLTVTAPTDENLDQSLQAARQSAGLGPVRSSATLDALAQGHAQDMAARGYFSHVSPDGVSFAARLSATGLRTCTGAENIAVGQRSVGEVMNSWMTSPGHRANILKRNVTHYGIGRAGNHWVLVVAQPC